MSSRKHRVGIIGCGWVSTGHMNGYKASPKTEVVAAADKDTGRLQEFSREYGSLKLYENYEDLLAQERPEIVSICTWPTLHYQMVLDASKYAKGILCEKPMSLSRAEARAMADACDSKDCKLLICHQRRFEPRFVRAKEFLDDGAIGSLLKVEAYGGDLFTDDHSTDLIGYYAGDVEVDWVMGQVDWQNRRYCHWGHNIEDSAIGYVKFANGVEGRLITGRAREDHPPYSALLVGTEGMIEVSGGNYPDPSWVVLLNGRGRQKFEIDNPLLGQPKTEILGKPTIAYYWASAWRSIVDSMVESIEQGTESIASARLALKTLDIISAIFESSRLRALIRFPLPDELDRPLDLLEETHYTAHDEDQKEAS